MDTLTHALTGTAFSDGWFRKRLGPVATPFSLIVAALPDIDSLTYFVSPEMVWAHHRGYTHSVIPMLLASPVLGYIGFRLARREGEWRLWTLLSVLCLFSHTILDLATSWGTMPFLPLSRARMAWDIAPVLDAFLFSLMTASFVLNRMLRWERKDTFLNPIAYPVVHRHPKRRRAADWVARVALALALVYLAVGWLQNRQTVRVAHKALTEQGVNAVEVRAFPVMFTYIAWQVAARDAEGAVYNGVHSSYAPKPMRFIRYATVPGEEIADVMAMPKARMFDWYRQGMGIAELMDEGTVRLTDRRFWGLGAPYASRFSMDFSPDGRRGWSIDRVTHAPLTWELARDEFRRLWRLTWLGEWDGNVGKNVAETEAQL